jgi:GNAT superfamily N-acetyltransferase
MMIISPESSSLARLVCRPALPQDKADVIELTRDIWEGHDYVPLVWDKWLADPQGQLTVAVLGSRVIGLIKLTLLSEQEWWLEGLRVHPAYEGRGIASHLHDYTLDYWLEHGSGKIRLVTASFRKPVHHLCERTGFRKIGEFTPFNAPLLTPDAGELINEIFQPLKTDEAETACRFALQSQSLRFPGGVMDIGWEWGDVKPVYIQETIEQGKAWWWRGKQGLLLIQDDEEDDEKVSQIQLAACKNHQMVDLLLDYRRLATDLGYQQIGWVAPLHPELMPMLAQAGFERSWEDSIWFFEKIHPGYPG